MFAGFKIAVNDPLFVRRFQGFRDLLRDRQGFIDRNRRYTWPMPPSPICGGDFVDAETRAGSEGHILCDYTGRSGSGNGITS